MTTNPRDPIRPRGAPEPLPPRSRVKAPFVESTSDAPIAPEILARRICDFDLRIEGRPLEKLIERFRGELAEHGITRLQPRFYLSDE